MRTAAYILISLLCLSVSATDITPDFLGRHSSASRNAMSLNRLSPYMPYERFVLLQQEVADSAGNLTDTLMIAEEQPEQIPAMFDITIAGDSTVEEPYFLSRTYHSLPSGLYNYMLFDTYHYLDSLPFVPDSHPEWTGDAFNWIDDTEFATLLLKRTRQEYMVNNPTRILYNAQWLPEPPKHYQALVDPTTTKIVFEEVPLTPAASDAPNLEIEHRHWLRTFNGNVQFSQAYISPNWYQGGNNNLNMLVNAVYNVKLNEKLHPNLLFETNISYKLGLNNAPNDTLHSYNISEDLFQVNSKFGLKAFKRWYYSVNALFKTQLLNNYPPNSGTLQAAFLSPAELNVGVGMSYSYTSPKKSINFGASISPLSYNLKMCFNSKINETAYGIDKGRHTASEYGSSAECNLKWKIAYNINYTSRLFVFTDYDYIYSDWEHTIAFDITRFLSTQIYAHLRYDTSSPRIADSHWHKFQLKEILSFGFSYKFSTL